MTDALTDDGATSMPTGRHTPDWLILAIACVAQFMGVLDVSIVKVALPSPAPLPIIVTTFSGARMAKALGTWAAVAGAGGAAGSILGGVLTAELSWRWVLFVNLPIGIVTAAAAAAYLTQVRRP